MPQATEKVTGAKGKIRRQQIIDVAKQTLIEGGSSSLVLRDVADQIGITGMGIFNTISPRKTTC